MLMQRIPEFGCWAVAEYKDGESQLPIITAFITRDQARDYMRGQSPSLLSKFKLHLECPK